jgi:iron complex outermembrane receptor protein
MTRGTLSRYRATVALGALALAMTPIAAAHAADAAASPAAKDDSGLRVQEVIVTSRKREESVERVPIAITAITGELKTADVRDLTDIVSFTPNVRIDTTLAAGRAGAADITIRGVSPTLETDNSIDSPIGVLIDGVYLGSLPGQIVQNFDIDRIEVLRGPQGTLFGRNTVGGAVNVFRTEPTGQWGANLQYTTGQWNDQEFRAVLNAPIIKDVLAFKLFFISQSRDGYLKNTFLNDAQPTKNYQNLGGELKFTPNDKFKALLTVEQFVDRSEGGAFQGSYNFCPGVLAKPTNPNDVDGSGGLLGEVYPAFFGLPDVPCRTSTAIPSTISTSSNDPGKVITNAYTLNMAYKLSPELKLVSVTGYRWQHEKTFFDFDGSSDNFINIATDAHYHQFSQEVRLEGNWDTGLGKIAGVVGGYYYNSYFNRGWTTSGDFWQFVESLSGINLANDTWSNPALAASTGYADPVSACLSSVPRVAPGTPGSTAQQNALFTTFGNVQCAPGFSGAYGPGTLQKLYETQSTDSVAFFAHADWEFRPKLTLTAGVRYTYEKKHFDGYQGYLSPTSIGGEFDFPGQPADLSNSWQRVTPTAALSYQMTPDILWYASFSEGWHSGGFYGVNQDTADFERNQYVPETSQSYEIGMKGLFFDRRVRLNIDGFIDDFQNKQESAVELDPSTNTVVTVFTNVGGVRYAGIEAEGEWVVTRRFHLSASFGWLDARYTSLEIQYPNAVNNNVPQPTNATFLVPRTSPPFTAGGEATYRFPVGPGEAQLQSKLDWVAKEYTTLYDESYDAVAAHVDLSAAASYSWKSYKVTLFGRNLTNHKIEYPFYIAPLFAASTITPGASWGVELAAKF